MSEAGTTQGDDGETLRAAPAPGSSIVSRVELRGPGDKPSLPLPQSSSAHPELHPGGVTGRSPSTQVMEDKRSLPPWP